MPASRNRLARTYIKVEKAAPNRSLFPYTTPHLVPSIQEGPYVQGLLANEENFGSHSDSRCLIFEIDDKGKGLWQSLEGQLVVEKYLMNTKQGHGPSYRIIFCLLARADGTSFRNRLALSLTNTVQLLERLKVSPHFVSQLLGEPNHWSPGNFTTYDQETKSQQLHLYCQLPRWYIHEQEIPTSIHMSHDFTTEHTTYVISCAESSVVGIKRRLCDHYCKQESTTVVKEEKLSPTTEVTPSPQPPPPDPLMLHCLLAHESLEDGKPLFTKLRHRLYDVLDQVDDYAAQPREKRSRSILEDATVGLHDISQDIDSTIASLDMAQANADELLKAQTTYLSTLSTHAPPPALNNIRSPRPTHQQTHDALAYVAQSTASQRRWLTSYKSRKDIAMNLVFNLVTQQDASSSQATALAAQADGASMKAIAALTMVFLPATFVATLFGMGALLEATWQAYLIVTVPLTGLVLLAWIVWTRLFPGVRESGGRRGRRNSRRWMMKGVLWSGRKGGEGENVPLEQV